MDFDDYETLPSENSTVTHMVAGSFAGIMEHCLMYPFDSVKTRMQSLKPHPEAKYRSVLEAFSKIIRNEGLFRSVYGMPAVMIAAGPAHALHFSCYEKVKRILNKNENGVGNPLAHGFAGATATLLHDAIMTPAEVVKQRMQVYGSPYRTCSDCFLKVLHFEGVRALYRSYSTQLMMNIPFQSIHFMSYEFFQDLTNHQRNYNPLAHTISGAMAGAFAAAITNPLDVCKTLLNTQEQQVLKSLDMKQTHITGLFNAALTIHRFSGMRGFLRGLVPRIIYQAPSTAISWSVYEFFKNFLQFKNQSFSFDYTSEHSQLVTHVSSMNDSNSHRIPGLQVVYQK